MLLPDPPGVQKPHADEPHDNFIDDYYSRSDTACFVADSGEQVMILDFADTETATPPIHVVDLPTGDTYTWTLEQPRGFPSLGFAADDRYIVYDTADGDLRFLDWRSGREYSLNDVIAPRPLDASWDEPGPWEELTAVHSG